MSAMKRRPGGRQPAQKRRGNCYVACEVLYHLMGGRRAGITPMVTRCPWDANERHWFLRQEMGGLEGVPEGWHRYRIIDPSRGQFTRRQRARLAEMYAEGRGCGFMTRQPSQRAQKLIDQLTWQEPRSGRASRPRQ